MPKSGQYANGDRWVLNTAGVKLTATDPASTIQDVTYSRSGGTRTDPHRVHGLMNMAYYATGTGNPGPNKQGFMSFAPLLHSDGVWSSYSQKMDYQADLNLDPAATGAPLVFTSGQEATLRKCITNLTNSNLGRGMQKNIGIMTICAAEPAAGDFRPGCSAPSKVSPCNISDLDLTKLPSFTLPGTAPDFATQMELVNIHKLLEHSNLRINEVYHPETTYRASLTAYYADLALLACCNITSAQKQAAAVALVQIAIDTVAALNTGRRYNWAGGLGGVGAGTKMCIVIAAALTGLSYFTDWAGRIDFSAEDRQVFTVLQSDLDRNQATYSEGDGKRMANYFLGQPEYNGQPGSPRGSNLDASTASSYRVVNYRHYIGQALAVMAITGARALWNNEAFFQYADRVMDKPFFSGGETMIGHARAQGTNAPNAFVISLWDTHRASLGSVWSWPA